MFTIRNDTDLAWHLKPGEVTVLESRPRTGKTALALSLLTRLTKEKKRAVYSSMDLTKDRIYRNFPQFASCEPEVIVENNPWDPEMMAIDKVVLGWRDLYEKSSFSVMIVDDIELIEPSPYGRNHYFDHLRYIAEFAEQFNITVIVLRREDAWIKEHSTELFVDTYSKNEITVMSKNMALCLLYCRHRIGFPKGFIGIVMEYSGFKRKKAVHLLKMMKNRDIDGLNELLIRFRISVCLNQELLSLEQADFIWQYLFKRVMLFQASTSYYHKQ